MVLIFGEHHIVSVAWYHLIQDGEDFVVELRSDGKSIKEKFPTKEGASGRIKELDGLLADKPKEKKNKEALKL